MNKRSQYILSVLLFSLYMVFLCYWLFFSERLGRTPSEVASYNFIPFKEILRYILRIKTIGVITALVNLLGNIVCFMPFGFLLSNVLKHLKPSFSLILGQSVLISICVELIQLMTKVGSCDIDDVILNTLGGLCGYGMYVLMQKLTAKKANQFKVIHGFKRDRIKHTGA